MQNLSLVSFEYLYLILIILEEMGEYHQRMEGSESGVGGLFRSYFSRNVEKLPSLRNRKSITPADSRRAGVKLMALLAYSPT